MFKIKTVKGEYEEIQKPNRYEIAAIVLLFPTPALPGSGSRV